MWKINQSVTVNLSTFVWIHICPQACRHGVPDVARRPSVGLKSQSLWVSFSRHALPESCCTSFHLWNAFSCLLERFFFPCFDCLKACDLITFVFLLCGGHEQNGHFCSFIAETRQWTCCMIECKKRKKTIVVYFICLIVDICTLHDFKIKVIL